MSDNPLLDTILEMTSASVDRVGFSDEALMLVRLAALVAVDAPPASYLVNLSAATGTDLTLDDARSVLIAIAPIVGAPRVVSAAGKIASALGLAIALDELAAEADEA
ncbi:MAG: hypothetical protein WCF04_02140 [Candidatus Nanopelagicales bacterium]